jgi:hypothetical protein
VPALVMPWVRNRMLQLVLAYALTNHTDDGQIDRQMESGSCCSWPHICVPLTHHGNALGVGACI